MPKKAALNNKLDDINAFLARPLTDKDLTDKMERKANLRKPFDPVIRERVRQELEDAKTRGRNEDVISSLEEQYDNMLRLRLAFGTSLKPAAPTQDSINRPMSQQDRLAEVNRENRRRNAEAVRNAQLREKKQIREIESRIARGEVVQEDMSRRLKTKAKFVYNPLDPSAEKKKDSAAGSGASTPANGTPKLSAQKEMLLPHVAKLREKAYAEKKGIPTIHKPLMDDDIIGALDLDIDVEI
jgi:RNA polymerase-associated protein RTF1